MHNVFISYHHANDQWYKDELVRIAKENEIFRDYSVDTGEIPEDWSDEKIREEIRDNYLRESSVTIVLVGTETRYRKHVDWEIYSSMYDGKKNKKSGIIIIQLPSINPEYVHIGHGAVEKRLVHPDIKSWCDIETRKEYENRYPYMPERIIDNLYSGGAHISVIKWSDMTIEGLRWLIDQAYNDRDLCDYDLSRKMRRRNG